MDFFVDSAFTPVSKYIVPCRYKIDTGYKKIFRVSLMKQKGKGERKKGKEK